MVFFLFIFSYLLKNLPSRAFWVQLIYFLSCCSSITPERIVSAEFGIDFLKNEYSQTHRFFNFYRSRVIDRQMVSLGFSLFSNQAYYITFSSCHLNSRHRLRSFVFFSSVFGIFFIVFFSRQHWVRVTSVNLYFVLDILICLSSRL